MASLNKAYLIGNVGKVEVRSVQGGAKVASLSLATSEKYTDRNNETHENTEWHSVIVWKQSAEFVEKYVQTGSLVFVEGKIKTREWTDQSGNKRRTTEIVAERIQLLGKKEEQRPSSEPEDMPEF